MMCSLTQVQKKGRAEVIPQRMDGNIGRILTVTQNLGR